MLWLLYALGVAFFQSIHDILIKSFGKKMNPILMPAAWTFFTFIITVPLIIIYGIPVIGGDFWWAVLITGFANAFAAALYVRSLQLAPLGLTVPMLAFTPAFLLIAAPLIIGEFPSMIGLVGILLIVIGSYILNLDKQKYGWFEPFRTLVKNKGSRYMLLIAAIFSVTSSVDKIVLQESSVIFFIASLTFIISGSLLAYGYITLPKIEFTKLMPNWKVLLLLGVVLFIVLFLHMNAISRTIVPFAISIKRMSIFLSVLYGVVWLKERQSGNHLAGAVLMLVGAMVIGVFG